MEWTSAALKGDAHLPMDPNSILLRRRQNAKSPAHALPAELLIRVFRVVALPSLDIRMQDALPTEEGYEGVYGLMFVSHYWAEVIKAAPSLWQVIDIRDAEPMQATALARSQSAPLILRVRPTLEGLRKRAGALDRFWEAVSPYSERWQSVDITLDYNVRPGIYFHYDNSEKEAQDEEKAAYNRTLSVLERCDASNLEHFRLMLHGYEGTKKAVDLFRNWSAPSSLKTVWLEHAALSDWGAQRLSGLRSLTLRQCMHGPSAEQLIEILRGSPLLEHVTLDGLGPDEGSNPIMTPAIHLPHLVTLELLNLHQTFCRPLYNTIELSAGEVFTFAGSSRNHSRNTEFIEPFFVSNLSSAKALKVTVNMVDPQVDVEVVASSPSSPGVYLSFEGSRLDTTCILEWVADLLKTTKLPLDFETTLDLLARETASPDELRDCLWTFTHITTLVINGLGGDLGGDVDMEGDTWSTFIQDLTVAGTAPAATVQNAWLLPRLTHLSLRNCPYGDAQLILEMVEKRIAAAKEANEGAAPAVARLKAVLLGAHCEMDDETIKAVKGVFGGDAVALRFVCDDDYVGYFVGGLTDFASMMASGDMSIDGRSLTVVA